MPPTVPILDELQAAIVKALGLSYTARSSQESKPTGNSYQSVTVGGSELGGFRSNRASFLSLFDWQDKTVLDIGSNLGELSRNVLSLGAAHVHGVEHDPLFVLLSDLISIRNRIDPSRYVFENTDVTDAFRFDKAYDIVLAFSVFTYIRERIAEVAEAAEGLLILETHRTEPDWESLYVWPLMDHFKTVVVLGESDWGLEPEVEEGHRVLVVGFKKFSLAWGLFNRIGMVGPNLSTRFIARLWDSDIPSLAGLKDYLREHDPAELSGLDPAETVAQAIGSPEPDSPTDVAYWLEYHRGYRHYRDSGDVVTAANPYVKTMVRLIEGGATFDPSGLDQMHDHEQLRLRVSRRFRDFKVIEDLGPATSPDESGRGAGPSVLLFDVGGRTQYVTIVTDSGSELAGTDLDGFHRIGAALLSGRSEMPLYHLRIFGSI